MLAEWVSLLKPGGLIKIVCPDVREIARQLSLEVIGIEWFNYLIFGGNDYEYNVHKYGFDMELLREMLINLDCVIEKEIPSREWENRRLTSTARCSPSLLDALNETIELRRPLFEERFDPLFEVGRLEAFEHQANRVTLCVLETLHHVLIDLSLHDRHGTR